MKDFGNVIVTNAVHARQVGKSVKPSESLDSISGSLVNSLLDSIDDEQMVADAALNYLSAGKPQDQRVQRNEVTLHR